MRLEGQYHDAAVFLAFNTSPHPMRKANELREVLRRWFGYYLPKGRDPDVEQAYVRLGISTLVLIYIGYVIWAEGWSGNLFFAIVAVGGLALFAAAQILLMRPGGAHQATWRTCAIAADVSAGTVGMAVSGEAGVPLVGIYLWVTVGNGFRFGPRYLIISYAISLVGATSLIVFAPFWMDHRSIGVGVFLALAVIPLYVLVLLSRLQAQRDSAEELSKAKSRFVANVSHELRTPLTGVYAVYDLLRIRRLSPDERELVAMLGKSIATLKASVDAILQMSKLEAGAERLQLRPFNLRFFLKALSADVEPQAVAKHLVFELKVDPKIPPTVQGDPDHIGHVLGNLLNNAFKFTHVGGVTLSAKATQHETIRFEVTDTGIGIPVEKQEHLFERFVQVDSSSSRRYAGTGLGTSIAHDLVELMNGQIGVVSAPEQGSTFWVELPLLRNQETTDLEVQPLAATILLVGNPGRERARVAELIEKTGATTIEKDLSDISPYPHVTAVALLADLTHVTAFVDAANRLGWLRTVPWFTISSNYSEDERTKLMNAGAVAFVNDELALLRLTIAGLCYRIAPSETDVESPPRATGVVRHLRILLADDNESIRILLAKILGDAGHTVSEVAKGDDAYDKIASGEVDLALLDLNMPDMTGPDVTKLYRAGEAGTTDRLPIIILSADATPIAKQESIDAGANDFLVKPIQARALLEAIERVCAGSAERQAASGESQTDQRVLPGLIDPQRLMAIGGIAGADDTFLNRYLEAAFEDMDRAVRSLEAVLGQQDERGARDALHILEGTGASIGAAAVLICCNQIREMLVHLANRDFAGDVAELATTVALTKSAIRAAVSPSPVTQLATGNGRRHRYSS